MPTEKELDRILETTFREDKNFADWFLGKTKFRGRSAAYYWSRSDNPWTTVELHLPRDTSCQGPLVRHQGETDLLVVFEAEDSKLAIHIENKLASGRFTSYQAELYQARAQKWVHNPDYGNYDEWTTVLVAPRSFVERNRSTAQKFDAIVYHEEIAEQVSGFQSGARYCAKPEQP